MTCHNATRSMKITRSSNIELYFLNTFSWYRGFLQLILHFPLMMLMVDVSSGYENRCQSLVATFGSKLLWLGYHFFDWSDHVEGHLGEVIKISWKRQDISSSLSLSSHQFRYKIRYSFWTLINLASLSKSGATTMIGKGQEVSMVLTELLLQFIGQLEYCKYTYYYFIK